MLFIMAKKRSTWRTFTSWTKRFTMNPLSHQYDQDLLADKLKESVYGEVAGSQPTSRTFIVLSRGAAPKTRNVKSERGETSSKVLEVCQRMSAISIHHSPDIWERDEKSNFASSSVTSQICQDARARIREILRLYIRTSNAFFHITPNSCHTWYHCCSSNGRFDAS